MGSLWAGHHVLVRQPTPGVLPDDPAWTSWRQAPRGTHAWGLRIERCIAGVYCHGQQQHSCPAWGLRIERQQHSCRCEGLQVRRTSSSRPDSDAEGSPGTQHEHRLLDGDWLRRVRAWKLSPRRWRHRLLVVRRRCHNVLRRATPVALRRPDADPGRETRGDVRRWRRRRGASSFSFVGFVFSSVGGPNGLHSRRGCHPQLR
mmetsp:Transcript_128161/g.409742  ORF Transcript_128161/g.409742 Transcript_128161/m.409742 type:complete len:202 (+) Transcript_128161:784-1389(+)